MFTRVAWVRALLCVTLSMTTLTACIHPYTPSVQQGNVITAAELSQLHVGMSKDQVQYLIGAPVLVDDLNPDQWDYVYTYQKSASNPMKEQKLRLIFKDNNLVSIDNGQLKSLGKL